MKGHLVLFDATCSLCWHSVERILAWDLAEQFYFSPLIGESSRQYLKEEWPLYKEARTLILIENFSSKQPKIWTRGRAVLRIFWLLGGWKKCLGVFAFFPWGIDWAYDLVAKNRHLLAGKCAIAQEKCKRFLK